MFHFTANFMLEVFKLLGNHWILQEISAPGQENNIWQIFVFTRRYAFSSVLNVFYCPFITGAVTSWSLTWLSSGRVRPTDFTTASSSPGRRTESLSRESFSILQREAGCTSGCLRKVYLNGLSYAGKGSSFGIQHHHWFKRNFTSLKAHLRMETFSMLVLLCVGFISTSQTSLCRLWA